MRIILPYKRKRRLESSATETWGCPKILAQHSGYPYAIALSGPPTKGPYVNVTLSYGPPPLAWVYIAHQTFYLIPGYFNGIAYEVQFDVFADNRLTHIYRHEIKLQSIGWIGLLPFVVWVKLFTTHFVEAFEATVYQFMTETISDGVCRTKAFLGQHILPLNRP